MIYDGPGVSPAEIAQKARDLQSELYERGRSPLEQQVIAVHRADFNRLVNVVTALAETTQWIFEHMHDKEEMVNLGEFKREVEYLSPDEPLDPAVSEDEPVIEYVVENVDGSPLTEEEEKDLARVNAKLKVAARGFRNKAVHK